MDEQTNRRRQVRDLLEHFGERALPLVSLEAEREELVAAMDRFRRNSLLFVVDEKNRLQGALAVKQLVRHLLAPSHEPQIHGRRLFNQLTSSSAEQWMIAHPLCATPEEDLRELLERMIQANVKEVPVLDPKGRVIGDLTLVDLAVYLER